MADASTLFASPEPIVPPSTSATPLSLPLPPMHIAHAQKPSGSPSSSNEGIKGNPKQPPAVRTERGDVSSLKRHRNTMAARKSRQKRLDHIADLEHTLGEVSRERDELRLQLARREAEVETLREALRGTSRP
ncbi:hypothetical protein RJ55_04331 [Drechmeria coniospora]|nr:hypothetical protein RJ55_04331 [Drechmeria coniospora]